MATPIDPGNAQGWDESQKTDPDFTSTHVFSTDDITVTFGGETVDKIADPLSVYRTAGAFGTKTTRDCATLLPIDSDLLPGLSLIRS